VIRGVVWDLDETLIREEAAVATAFARAAERGAVRAGVPREDLAAAARRSARDRWRAAPDHDYCAGIGIASWEALRARFLGEDDRMRRLRAWAPGYRVGAWADALAEHGVADTGLAEELSAVFVTASRSAAASYPDAVDALAALHGVLPMAVLTNGASCLQREKVDEACLAGWFDFVLVSGDIGVGKPDARPFALCAERLGADPGALLMVGDSVERDIAGARGAGFRALWLDRDGVGSGARGEFDTRPTPLPDGALAAGSLWDLDLAALRNGEVNVMARDRRRDAERG
jgi:putative hydrolase of the HAD superfamily